MRKLPLVTAVVVGLASATLIAPAAHAATVDVTCAGTETVRYDPGLLLIPETVHGDVTGILAPCSSSDRGLTTGNYQESFSTSLSCATLLAPRTGTRVFHWSNGQTSTFTFNRALNNVAGQTTVTLTGDITSGEFAGDTALEQVTFVTPTTLQCLNPLGLTALGPGPAVLTLTAVG
ncbi:hypothetical protein ACIQB5_33210 [Streptomyces sp. NPDC088560]|uniref:hypothetical protein n=1 Tax=Streptomyces sp. NPDC088560 TaxID=3365868 RepID=UPI003801725C